MWSYDVANCHTTSSALHTGGTVDFADCGELVDVWPPKNQPQKTRGSFNNPGELWILENVAMRGGENADQEAKYFFRCISC